MDAGLSEMLVPVAPRPARLEELHGVHPPAYLASLERLCSAGGGRSTPTP